MAWNRTHTASLLLIPLLLASACAVVLLAQEPSSTSKPQTLKVDVDQVLVNATVSDVQGRMVTGLGREHFQLWEDKVEQKIEYLSAEDMPLSIGLIFDATGSMSDKLSTARDAAAAFLKTGNPDDEYFLVTFSDRARLAQSFTTDLTQLQS